MATIEMISSISNKVYFANFLKKTGERLKSSRHEIEWKCIIDIGGEVPDGFRCIHKQECERGSANSHAKALNFGAQKASADCTVFIDSDMAFLYKDWDTVLVNRLKRCDSFGVSHKHDFFRYHNYPVCQFMAFSKRAMTDIEWDFLPEKHKKIIRNKIRCTSLSKYKANKRDAKICGVPVGTILKKDTSWRVPYLLHKKGYTESFVMDLVPIISENTLIPYESEEQKEFCHKICLKNKSSGKSRMAEYHYNKDVYCSHFGRSRENRRNEEYEVWSSRIKAYVLHRYGIEL